MRIARDLGTVHELLPDGIDDLRDCPHPLFEAIRAALVFLSFDELPKDERPRKRLWTDGEALKAHFEGVERARERRSKGDDEIEDPVNNAAAARLIAE